MVTKAENLTGNDWVVICNSKFWNMVGDNLMDELARWTPCDAVMYSKVEGRKKSVGEKVPGLKVGNTFTAYEYQGNTITFMPERVLDYEYPNEAFGFILDLTADMAAGKPAIESWTFKGADMVRNTVEGVNLFTCAA